MCFTTLPKQHVNQMIVAAQHLQELLKAGTLDAAFTGNDPDKTATAVAAFDRLQECATRLASEQKNVSPFLRYRREIMGQYETAQRLRALVLNLWGGRPANLSQLFMNADALHTRIALECIASYTTHGENDSQFMSLATEIIDNEHEERAA